jgi:hypothetical protein
MRHYHRRFALCGYFITKNSMNSKPSNNNAWTTEIDPTLMAKSMPSTDQGHRESYKTSGHHSATVTFPTGQEQLDASQAAPTFKRQPQHA